MNSIAKVCGVSKMTVSRALNPASTAVSEETRKFILTIAKKCHYRLNVRMGRPRVAAATGRKLVDVILGTALGGDSLFYGRLLVAIERALAAHSFDCVIRTCTGAFEPFLSLVDVLKSAEVRQVLVLGYFPFDQLQTILELVPHALVVDQVEDSRLPFSYEYIGFDNLWQQNRVRCLRSDWSRIGYHQQKRGAFVYDAKSDVGV